MATWHILVPVRGGLGSKSRLAAAVSRPEDRFALALAFATDVVTSALAAKGAAGVTVITADAGIARHLAAVGADIVAEPEAGGLNAAVGHGAAQLRRMHAEAGIAVLMGDVPEATPASISEALAEASVVDLGVVADHEGTGTTMLTAAAGLTPRPSYGEGSFERHVAAGHVPLAVPEHSPLRNDIDAREDLLRALRSGSGPHTEAALHRLDLFGPGTADRLREPESPRSPG